MTAWNEVWSAVLSAEMNLLWQGAALAGLAWLVLRYVVRTNAATRHAIWWAVLAVVLVLPALPWLLTRQNAGESRVAATVEAAPAVLPVSTRTVAWEPEVAPARRALRLPLEFPVGRWPMYAGALWCLLCAVQSARVLASYLHVRGIKRRAKAADRDLQCNFDEWLLQCRVGRNARLLISDEIVSPMAVGFSRPAVILPASLPGEISQEQMDHVLLHELSHLARRDDWTNLLARLAGGVFVMNPLVHWIVRQVDRERELSCDDWVVAVTGSARPYAASLARLFELCCARRREMLATGMADHASDLGRRIEILLRRGREFTAGASSARVVAVGALLTGLGLFAAQSPQWISFTDSEVVMDAQEPPAAPVAPAPPEAPAPPPKVKTVKSTKVPPAPPAPPTPPATAVGSAPPVPPEPPEPPAPPSSGRGSLLAALVANGYGNLSVDEIISLRDMGVTGDYITGINQAGWGKLTPAQMIELRTMGVSADYIKEIREAGIKDLTLREATELRMHGVRPQQLQEIHRLGFGPYTAKQAKDLAIHGVRPDFFKALQDEGFGKADFQEILEARMMGVNSSDLRAARKYGSNLTLRQVIKLKTSGVL
jgi:beta-lactamase regulating signal transducer with metallopeptidase domain